MATVILGIHFPVKDAETELNLINGTWRLAWTGQIWDRISNADRQISNPLKIRWPKKLYILLSWLPREDKPTCWLISSNLFFSAKFAERAKMTQDKMAGG